MTPSTPTHSSLASKTFSETFSKEPGRLDVFRRSPFIGGRIFFVFFKYQTIKTRKRCGGEVYVLNSVYVGNKNIIIRPGHTPTKV